VDERRFPQDPDDVEGLGSADAPRGSPSAPENQGASGDPRGASGGASASPRVHDKRGSRHAEQAKPVDLEDELAKARKEAAEHLDDLRRLKAEFENYRKRILREQTHLVERASEQLVERLLPILDNFELALIAADRTSDYEALVRGVEIVFGELMDLLHKEGLQKIDALGKPFDPTMHEAVLEVGDGPADGEPVVAEVVRNGYTVKGKVVRPAMVKVIRR
jgi:molecular chaperone GrpE